MDRFDPLTEEQIFRALLRVGGDASIPAPAGRVAVNRSALLAELDFTSDDATTLDEALGRIGGDVVALERPRSLSLTLGSGFSQSARPPEFFYLVSRQLLIATP